jgi:hypothetical protein
MLNQFKRGAIFLKKKIRLLRHSKFIQYSDRCWFVVIKLSSIHDPILTGGN